MEHVIKQRLLKSKKQEFPCPFKCIVIQEKSDIRHPISTPKGMVVFFSDAEFQPYRSLSTTLYFCFSGHLFANFFENERENSLTITG